MSREQQLSAGLSALGIDLSAEVQAKLLAYTLFLEKWNRSFSLPALRDPTLAVSHHLLDSLAILPYVTAPNLLDVGSGGGQPGIPLAIAKPELTVTLLDSNSKKTAFLQQADRAGVEERTGGDGTGRGIQAGCAVCRDYLTSVR